MTDERLSDEEIIDAWHANAAPWTNAVRSGDIESRRLITDDAIVGAVLGQLPASVIDIGCGEGWLARALSAEGIRVVGIDVVPELIERARRAGGGDFRVMSYEAVAAGELALKADVVVCNFSLIGEASVDGVISTVRSLLNSGGALIVQTLHPMYAGGEAPYVDGWRAGSWSGFSSDFSKPAPWYFRTVETWHALFARNGLRLQETREPIHPNTGKPASILYIAHFD